MRLLTTAVILALSSGQALAQGYPYNPTYPLGPAQGGPPYGAAFDYGARAYQDWHWQQDVERKLDNVRRYKHSWE